MPTDEGFSHAGKAAISIVGGIAGVVGATVVILSALGLVTFGHNDAKASNLPPGIATTADLAKVERRLYRIERRFREDMAVVKTKLGIQVQQTSEAEE